MSGDSAVPIKSNFHSVLKNEPAALGKELEMCVCGLSELSTAGDLILSIVLAFNRGQGAFILVARSGSS